MSDQLVKSASCAKCGGELTWEECWECGGDGEYDAYDIDPNWYLPGEYEECDTCDGEGGWLKCPYCGYLDRDA